MSKLVSESLCKLSELVDAPIAEERPPAAHILASLHVYVDDDALLFVGRCLIEQFALWTCHE